MKHRFAQMTCAKEMTVICVHLCFIRGLIKRRRPKSAQQVLEPWVTIWTYI